MNYRFLGWVALVLLVVMVSPFILRLLHSKVFKSKSKGLLKVIKALRTIHKPLGLALVLLGAVHGIGMLGRVRLHSGSLVLMSLILTGVLGLAFWKKKDKRALMGHRVMSLVTVILLLLHLFWPGALFRLFGI